MKKTVEFHDVVIRFSVRTDAVPECVDGFPTVREWLDDKFGRTVSVGIEEQSFDSEIRRSAVAIIARQGVGSNDMNGLPAEDITVTVDGSVLIDEVGGTT